MSDKSIYELKKEARINLFLEECANHIAAFKRHSPFLCSNLKKLNTSVLEEMFARFMLEGPEFADPWKFGMTNLGERLEHLAQIYDNRLVDTLAHTSLYVFVFVSSPDYERLGTLKSLLESSSYAYGAFPHNMGIDELDELLSIVYTKEEFAHLNSEVMRAEEIDFAGYIVEFN